MIVCIRLHVTKPLRINRYERCVSASRHGLSQPRPATPRPSRGLRSTVPLATAAEHFAGTIDSPNWWELGHVSNTTQAVINNCLIVALTDRSAWTVTGTSYLSALSLDATSRAAGPRARKVTMTVDGTPTAITAGASYTGAIVLTVA